MFVVTNRIVRLLVCSFVRSFVVVAVVVAVVVIVVVVFFYFKDRSVDGSPHSPAHPDRSIADCRALPCYVFCRWFLVLLLLSLLQKIVIG